MSAASGRQGSGLACCWCRYRAGSPRRKDTIVHPCPLLVPITRPPTRWLRLFRPATLDLILTKMMRGDDPQDMADVAFLIRHDRITPEQVESAMAKAVLPDLVELRDAFERAKPRVRELARQAGSAA